MGQSRYTGILLLLLGVAAFGLAGQRNASDLSPEEKQTVDREVKNTFRSMFIGDIFVSGRVVDEHGGLLTNVAVRLAVSAKKEYAITTNVSGEFSFAFTNCTEVRCRFARSDRFDVVDVYSIDTKIPMAASGRRTIWDTNKVVVLEELGEVTPLRQSNRSLEFSVSNTCEGVRIRRDGYRDVAWLAKSGVVSLAEGTLYVTATTAGDRFDLSTVQMPGGSAERPYVQEWLVPKETRLGITGVSNGIVMYAEWNAETPDWKGLRKMKDAPAGGYQSEIVLPKGRKCLFFFVVGGLYGKGIVGDARCSDPDDTGVDPFVALYLQPDGSRNVRSLQ